MFRRNVARGFKISVGFLLMSSTVFLAQATFAQSWGQLKDAALDAASKKDFAAAEQSWRKSLEISGATGARYLQSTAGLAKLYADSGKPDQAEALYKKIESAAVAGSLSDDERSALSNYAQFLKQKGGVDQAAELEKKFSLTQTAASSGAAAASGASAPAGVSVTDPKASAQKEYPIWFEAFKSAGDAISQKNYAQAEKLLKEVLPIAEKYADSSLMASSTLAKLEEICAAQGKSAEGEGYSMRKVAAVRMTKGPMTKEFAQALMDHAGWLRKLNRKSEAIAEEGKAESILAHISPKQQVGGISSSGPTAVDASGTRSGGLVSRAKAAQGLGKMVNDIINQPDN